MSNIRVRSPNKLSHDESLLDFVSIPIKPVNFKVKDSTNLGGLYINQAIEKVNAFQRKFLVEMDMFDQDGNEIAVRLDKVTVQRLIDALNIVKSNLQ